MLDHLLSLGRPLVADGATGTNLFDMGLVSGETPETWNELFPERVRALHQAFVDAGADIILTNSFGGNARRLMLHSLEGRTRELNRMAARLARGVADGAGRPVAVAGSVGPTGDLLAPLGPITEAEAVEVFVDQMEGLREGGVDVLWVETMSAPEEMRAAATAAGRVGMPYVVTASFDTAGKTMMGLSPAGMAAFVATLDPKPLAYGANCGVGASDLLVSVRGMLAADPDAIVVAKANCGVPQWHGDHIHYSGSPELMADYGRLAIDSGVRIVGGCCGTTAAHLAALKAGMAAHERGPAPSVQTIVERIGALVMPLPNEEPVERKPRRRS